MHVIHKVDHGWCRFWEYRPDLRKVAHCGRKTNRVLIDERGPYGEYIPICKEHQEYTCRVTERISNLPPEFVLEGVSDDWRRDR